MLLAFQGSVITRHFPGRFSFVLRPVRIFAGGFQIGSAGYVHVADVVGLLNQCAVPQPNPHLSEKFAVEGIDFQSQPAIVVPIPLSAGAVVHGEGTEQMAVFIPLPAKAVRFAVVVTLFFSQLAVVMPCAAKAVKLPSHFPVFHADLSVAVIKPLYATFRHVCKSTTLSV